MDNLKILAILIILLPLTGSLLIGFLHRIIKKNITNVIIIFCVGSSCILSCYILWGFLIGHFQTLDITLYVWGESASYKFYMGFLLDKFVALMIWLVSTISFLVHLYSIEYMRHDYSYNKFFCFISFFTFAMLMLVMSDNLLHLFFSWEAVGLASYLLIGFWFEKEEATNAGLKAFWVNRIADFCLLIGIAAIFNVYGTLNYLEIIAALPNSTNFIDLICMLLLIGAMGKSAQIPLHIWLPDSMEGPIPVSALIHSATMVTAGIFVIVRMFPLFEHSAITLNMMLIIGVCSCFFMGLLAIVQNDIKRVMAYSTVSQLGCMMTALGASAYVASIFHLITHAFFKTLLFLAAGFIILTTKQQDIRKMGYLNIHLPVSYVAILIGCLALIGFPGFSGFYSKDLIILAVKASRLPAAKFSYVFLNISVFITTIYSFRLFFLMFYARNKLDHTNTGCLKEKSLLLKVILSILIVISIICGIIICFYMRENPFKAMLYGFTELPFWISILGFLITWICYIRVPKLTLIIRKKLSLIYFIFIYEYGVKFIQAILITIIKGISWLFWYLCDCWIINDIIVNGGAKCINIFANIARKIQTGYLYHYTFIMIMSFFMLLVWLTLTQIA